MSDSVRSLALILLVVFSAAALFGYTLVLDLRPAKAFLGIGDIVFDPAVYAGLVTQTLVEKLWDFVKDVAKQFMLQFVSKFTVSLLQKLERLHIIKNILFYSDAIGFDQTIGNALNKAIMKPKTKAEAQELQKPEETNLAAIAAGVANNMKLNRKQIEQLAKLSSQSQAKEEEEPDVSAGSGGVSTFAFQADKAQVAKGGKVLLTWVVNEPKVAKAKLCQEDVQKTGSKAVNPNQTTTYVLNVYNSEGTQIGFKTVTVTVPGTKETVCQTKKKGPGLGKAEEARLVRGALVNLTTQLACGGINERLVQNVAIYQAAKARGVDPLQIDPRSGNFYSDMARYGNPFASTEFQRLTMQDTASTLEAQGNYAVSQELNSNGLKALRAEQNNITRSSQTIAGFIEQSFNNALNSLVEGSSTSYAAAAIGNILANILVSAIFSGSGRVLAENPYCGIANLAAGEIFDGTIGVTKVGNASITVNGKEAVVYKAGDPPVLVEWSVEETEDTKDAVVAVTNLPAGCEATSFAGRCAVSPTGDRNFELTITDQNGTRTLGRASIVIQEAAVASDITFTASPSSTSPGGRVTLSWSVQGTSVNVEIIGVSDSGLPPSGSIDVFPNVTTTYVLRITDALTGQQIASKSVTVTVSGGGVAGASAGIYLSPSFNVRE